MPRKLMHKLIAQRQLILMSLPFMLVVIVFSYLPLWGWVMAFQDYSIGKGMLHSPFVGLANFKELLADPQFYLVFRNTLVMSGLTLVVSFISAIGLAILLNEVRFKLFKRSIQTITYIPHFVSWVVIANIVVTSLSPNGGIVNVLLMKLGVIREPFYFLAQGHWFWFIHTFASVWKELGWSTIIYLAVIAGINPEQYEAADVDGAGRWAKIRHVTLPGLLPTATILLIIAVGNLMQGGYESQYLLGNSIVIDYSQVLDLYALDYSFSIGEYSYGVAISMFKTVISIILVLAVNRGAGRMSQTKLF